MTGPTARLWAGVLLLLALGVGYVVMQARGLDPAPLVLFAGPLVTYLIVGSKVDGAAELQAAGRKAQNATLADQNATLADHSQALAVITRQTNGVLDQRIREAAGAAVIKHLMNAGPGDLVDLAIDPSGELSP